MMGWCWPIVYDAGPTSTQHRFYVSCFLCSQLDPCWAVVVLLLLLSKHEALTQCWVIVAPPSTTLVQQWPTIGSMPCVFWDDAAIASCCCWSWWWMLLLLREDMSKSSQLLLPGVRCQSATIVSRLVNQSVGTTAALSPICQLSGGCPPLFPAGYLVLQTGSNKSRRRITLRIPTPSSWILPERGTSPGGPLPDYYILSQTVVSVTLEYYYTQTCTCHSDCHVRISAGQATLGYTLESWYYSALAPRWVINFNTRHYQIITTVNDQFQYWAFPANNFMFSLLGIIRL